MERNRDRDVDYEKLRKNNKDKRQVGERLTTRGCGKLRILISSFSP